MWGGRGVALEGGLRYNRAGDVKMNKRKTKNGKMLLPLAAAALAGGVLYLVAPGLPRKQKRAAFAGRNYAHRGLFGKEQNPPENSLPAFVAAARQGYGIELDVQFTRDEKVVAFHDDTLDRMTKGSGFVHDILYDDLTKLRLADSGETVPLFEEMLSAVAEENPQTPLIVEIKSRQEYTKIYLHRLVGAVLAALEWYPGPYCVESFDPRVVGIVRSLAPDVLRGQLADSYHANRGEKVGRAAAYFTSHLMGNFLGRPDFIAWCPRPYNWSVRLCRALGAMQVMWTALPEDDSDALQKKNDVVIFQWYRPKTRF